MSEIRDVVAGLYARLTALESAMAFHAAADPDHNSDDIEETLQTSGRKSSQNSTRSVTNTRDCLVAQFASVRDRFEAQFPASLRSEVAEVASLLRQLEYVLPLPTAHRGEVSILSSSLDQGKSPYESYASRLGALATFVKQPSSFCMSMPSPSPLSAKTTPQLGSEEDSSSSGAAAVTSERLTGLEMLQRVNERMQLVLNSASYANSKSLTEISSFDAVFQVDGQTVHLADLDSLVRRNAARTVQLASRVGQLKGRVNTAAQVVNERLCLWDAELAECERELGLDG